MVVPPGTLAVQRCPQAAWTVFLPRGRSEMPAKSRSNKPAPRGFAAMDAKKQREIASKGGQSVPAEKRSFSQDHQLAASAGRKGGEQSHASRNNATATRATRAAAAKRAAAKKAAAKRPSAAESTTP